jgi:hypothetical protein
MHDCAEESKQKELEAFAGEKGGFCGGIADKESAGGIFSLIKRSEVLEFYETLSGFLGYSTRQFVDFLAKFIKNIWF